METTHEKVNMSYTPHAPLEPAEEVIVTGERAITRGYVKGAP